MKSLAIIPAHKTTPYLSTTDTVRKMDQLASGPRGELSSKVRLTVENVIREVEPKDRLSQMAALYDWLTAHWSYVNDPIEVELVKDPERILEEVERHGRALGDCDDASTFLVAACRTIGIPATFTRVGFDARQLGDSYSHVYAVATDQYGRQVVLDPVAGPRTSEMLGRTKKSIEGLGDFRETVAPMLPLLLVGGVLVLFAAR